MTMEYKREIARYRNLYVKLLRFYPKPYRERFGESMEQTFNDLCHERKEAGDKLFGFMLWIFVETSTGIIKENITFYILQNKGIIHSAVGTGLILLIPLVLTLLNPHASINGGEGGGWDWEKGDFIVMGVLLFSTGLALDFAARKITNSTYRVIACAAIVLALLGIWSELAVDTVSQTIKFLFG